MGHLQPPQPIALDEVERLEAEGRPIPKKALLDLARWYIADGWKSWKVRDRVRAAVEKGGLPRLVHYNHAQDALKRLAEEEAKAYNYRCSRCHRPIWVKASVERGVGPICAHLRPQVERQARLEMEVSAG